MRIALLALIALIGCKTKDPLFCKMHPADPACSGIDAALIDGNEDGDAPDGMSPFDARSCFGTGAYEVCLQPPPNTPQNFNQGVVIDTATETRCLSAPLPWIDNLQPDACFIVGTTVTIQDMTVRGTRPIVFVGTDKIIISGHLDAASHALGGTGPGAPFVDCLPGTVPATNIDGGGGGAGASFTTQGGDGGNGDVATAKGVAAIADVTAPVRLRAGCTGQKGANGNGATGGGGGRGGGAVFLLAGNSIDLTASAIVNVSGAGGAAPGSKGGGGGGGSGGMIILFAPVITDATGAKLVANGGSGAGGANNGGGGIGNDPNPATPLIPATGGDAGGACTGDGGNGYAGVANPGLPGADGCGGGGGGGAGGYIQSNLPLPDTVASPAITPG